MTLKTHHNQNQLMNFIKSQLLHLNVTLLFKIICPAFESGIRKVSHFILSALIIWQTLYPSLSFASQCNYDEEVVTVSNGIPYNFLKWQYVEHIDGDGGGTGIHIYQEPKTQQKDKPPSINFRAEKERETKAKGLNVTVVYESDRSTYFTRLRGLTRGTLMGHLGAKKSNKPA